MTDAFMIKTRVANPADAMRNSIRAALQRNKTYVDGSAAIDRKLFRRAWAFHITEAAKRYSNPITDAEHCKAIAQIAQSLTDSYKGFLLGKRLRFGTSQKAFNLYLKFLWRLGLIPMPPHCPVDGVVLHSAGISGSWTQSDSSEEYMRWIDALRQHAGRNLSEWEYEKWNQAA
jgi:hypothetical protein